MKPILQGGEAVSRHAHNVEVEGSTPSPATNNSRHGVVQNGGGLTVRADEPPLQSAPPVSAMEKEYRPSLVAGRERAMVSPEAIARVLAQLEQAAELLGGRYIEGLIEQTLTRAAREACSPWLDRAGAAAYCRCSTSEIDRQAALGVLSAYARGGTPLYRRDDLDDAIRSGRWKKRNQAKT